MKTLRISASGPNFELEIFVPEQKAFALLKKISHIASILSGKNKAQHIIITISEI